LAEGTGVTDPPERRISPTVVTPICRLGMPDVNSAIVVRAALFTDTP
jgi:hypothetical protein